MVGESQQLHTRVIVLTSKAFCASRLARAIAKYLIAVCLGDNLSGQYSQRWTRYIPGLSKTSLGLSFRIV